MDLGRYHKRIDAVCDHYFRDITNWGSEKPDARVVRYVTDEILDIPNDTLIQPSMQRCSQQITRFHTMMYAKVLSS